MDESSVKIENNPLGPDGLLLGGDIFKESGTLLEYEEMDGNLPPGYQYSGYVTLTLRIEEA